MTDRNKFEQDGKQMPVGVELIDCELCEAMCLDAVDGALTVAEEAAFERHVAGCVACSLQLSEAKRGAAWMEMLKEHRPEPPAALLAKILAQTSGVAGSVTAAAPRVAGGMALAPTRGPVAMPTVGPLAIPVGVPAGVPVAGRGNVLPFPKRMAAAFSFGSGETYFQPRLAMTAAMAFFSIALTMNLTGTRLSDLRPSALHRTVADVGANAARSFQSMRVVYQVESRVSELRSNDVRGGDDDRDLGGPFGKSDSSKPSEGQTPAKPDAPKQEAPKQDKPAAPNGSSELVMPSAARIERVAQGSGNGTRTTQGPDAPAMRKGV